ncbi:MAG: HAD family hydrolase [Actinobacteria bacterium]|nr:HAD family hydrolase [Actinomycetota bacterium]
MCAAPTIEAVTFDFWNTIFVAGTQQEARDRRVGGLRELLAGAGWRSTDERLAEALDEVGRVFNDHWHANAQFTHVEAIDLLLQLLEVSLDEATMQELIGRFTGERVDFCPQLTPNVACALSQLKARGIRLGIICDVGLTPSTVLRRHLDGHGLLDLFDHWSFSDEVGHFKPAAEIFRHALSGLHVTPDRAAHVGDLLRTDVTGALAVGMTAVRYRGAYDDDDANGTDATFVIDDHADLAHVLGLF